MQTQSEITLIRSFLDSDRRKIIVAIIASVISGASSALLIAFVGKQFVTTEPFGGTSIALFMILLILSVATNIFAGKVLIEASSEHSYTLRMALCRRILSTRLEQIEKIGNHRLIAMLSEDLNDIAIAFSRIPDFTTNFTRVFFCVAYLLWVAPVAMSVLMLFSIPVAYVQILLYRYARKRIGVMLPLRDHRYRLYGILTTGFRELVVDKLTRVGFFNNQLDKNARNFKVALQNTFMANQYAVNWGQSSYFVIIFGLLIVASHGFVTKEIVAAITLVGLFIRGSLNSILQAVPLWMKASVAVDKMNSMQLSSERPALFAEIDVANAKIPVSNVALKMSEVQYSYVNDRSAEVSTLGPFNLEFSSGELIFVTGGNGSGKTTMVKLLTSLYEPSVGCITLNGERLSEDSEEWYRNHFYAVFSEFCLVGELFRSLQGNADNDMAMHLEKLRLPSDLIDTSSDLNFKELSSGQQARLALLPVFLVDKPVLIFDEWAAHQDPEFKRLFYYQLLPELKKLNKLIIVITHDDKYFDSADRIVNIEFGCVVEDYPVVKPSVGYRRRD